MAVWADVEPRATLRQAMLTRRNIARLLSAIALVTQAALFLAVCGCGTAATETNAMTHCGAEKGLRIAVLMSCCCDEKNDTSTPSIVPVSPERGQTPHSPPASSIAVSSGYAHPRAIAASRLRVVPPRPPLRV